MEYQGDSIINFICRTELSKGFCTNGLETQRKKTNHLTNQQNFLRKVINTDNRTVGGSLRMKRASMSIFVEGNGNLFVTLMVLT